MAVGCGGGRRDGIVPVGQIDLGHRIKTASRMEVPSWIGSEKRNFLSGFPHQEHTEWLECGNCHPEIFNIRKKSTKHFETIRILEGEFCGTCHLNVAFPISDCKRCHPDIKEFQ